MWQEEENIIHKFSACHSVRHWQIPVLVCQGGFVVVTVAAVNGDVIVLWRAWQSSNRSQMWQVVTTKAQWWWQLSFSFNMQSVNSP